MQQSNEAVLGVLADIHGNAHALRAVLAEIKNSHGDIPLLILGDLVAMGVQPHETLELLTTVSQISFIRGNTDRYVASGDRPVMPDDTPQEKVRSVDRSYQWTTDAITDSAVLSWLGSLPTQIRMKAGNTAIEAVHAGLGRDDGPPYSQANLAGDLARELSHLRTDMLCVGHSHRPLKRAVHGIQIINPGSVSNPVGSDARAKYVVLRQRDSVIDASFCRVEYDHSAYMDLIVRSGHPAADKLLAFQRGEREYA